MRDPSPHPDPLPRGGEGDRSELEKSLRQGGEKVSEGRIRIDSARALQRLRDFRFAEPAHWVLEVLRAAALSGAKNVDVRTDSDDVEVSFDGKPFPQELMKHLLEQALNASQTPDEQRTRLLSLGIAGALGVSARFVKVHSGGLTLTLEGEKVELTEEPGKLTTLHLRKAFGWRVTAAFFRGSPEARAITDRAFAFPAKLSLNGKAVRRAPPAPVVSKELSGEGWTLEVWLPPGAPLKTSTLDLDVGGVLVAQRSKQLPGLQVHARLRADGLRRNASGSDVVDDDPLLADALHALRKVSRELLAAHGGELVKDEAWRQSFIERLLADDFDEPSKKAVGKLPLLPDPAGEWLSLAELAEYAREHTRVNIATREYPKGSFPPPTVLLLPEANFERLLPPGKRVDVEAHVKKNELIALNRARHQRMEVESPVLPNRPWVARARVEATAVVGEVGFEQGGNGAFVRILHQGRLIESGELPSLAPLRLRAVIDWNRPLGDGFFTDDGSQKLLGLVSKYVETTAVTALCEALPRPEVLPHALDLLTRLVVLRGTAPTELPGPLRAAPLFPCLEGPAASLATLLAEPRWRVVNSRFPAGLLDGSRVLLLSPAHVEILRKLAPKKLEDVSTQLRNEEEVRGRLAGPRRTPTVDGVIAKVPVEGEGLRGEVGIPVEAIARLELTLLKSGLVLETTELSARYQHAVASVDCEALSPNARWTAVTRDAGFKRVLTAVHEAQRRLVVALLAVPRADWSESADLFFSAFLEKELYAFEPGNLDELTRAVASAPVFHGAHGPRTLLQLHAQVRREGHFFVLATSGIQVPQEMEVLIEPSALAAVLGEVLGQLPEDPTAVLTALDARRRLAALPKADFQLPAGLSLVSRLEEENFTVLAGLRRGLGDQASGFVHLEGRVYSPLLIPCALPLEVVLAARTLEPNAARELTGDQLRELGEVVRRAMHEVIEQALTAVTEDPESQRALLLAIAHSIDLSLPEAHASALLARPIFPCTDGQLRSVDELDHDSPQFVSVPMEGELPNRRPIVVAAEPAVKLALGRWRRAEEVGGALSRQLLGLRKREALAKVSEVVCSVKSPWRQRVSERGLTGELVVAGPGAGRLELFIDHKPLCVLEGVLPAPLAAAIDSPRLTPKPGFTGVVEDEHLAEVIDALGGAAERMAAGLAGEPTTPELVQLAFWVASTLAWQWKGKKKAKKGKKKADAPTTEHPLLAAPLLRTSDGRPLSVQALVTMQRAHGHVDLTGPGGRFLEEARVAWWPRLDEERWAAPLGLVLNDVTPALVLAESIRRRPRFETLEAPVRSQWREPVRGPSIEGEVALPFMPHGVLSIEVLHQRMLLETWTSKHEVGGVARVDSAALKPDERWTAARRDASFKALVEATELALERLLVRRLERLTGPECRAWAAAAVRWRGGRGGPLAALVPSLPLFAGLGGTSLCVGAVIDLAARKGRVPVAQPGSGKVVSGVLLDSKDTRAMLSTLGLQCEDVSAELSRAKNLEQELTARRLASLTWKGEALVKRAVSSGPLSGELALSAGLEQGEVMLARDGIPVARLEDSWPGVAGVIDIKDLVVNDDWTTAQPTRAHRNLIQAQVELLFTSLAEGAQELSERYRELAAHWALRYLADQGVETSAHLDRLTGVSLALSDAPFFLTVEGERIDLKAVAAEVSSREKVAVLMRGWGAEGAAHCVLATSSWDSPWLSSLEELFGKTKVWKVTQLEDWRQQVREADPPEGTAELQGLRFLRREVRLLRSGALGSLTPNELEDVKLRRAGGRTPLRYEGKRKLVLLDPDHPDIKRTLAEAKQRPERLWVLIAAIFGLVNRELEHVTDAQEAQLLLSLAGHLATNKQL